MERIDLVVKIGSMALIQAAEGAIDYNIFQRLGSDLRPGMLLAQPRQHGLRQHAVAYPAWRDDEDFHGAGRGGQLTVKI